MSVAIKYFRAGVVMEPPMSDERETEVLLSLDLEYETGYDSIPTIEEMYGGLCVWPGCQFTSRDAHKMWRHVHFGRKHGRSFGKTFQQLLEERCARIGEHS